MKNVIQIIILVVIVSCNSKKNTDGLITDEEFEYCSELKYNKAINLGPANGKLSDKKNIHSLLEKSLIKEKYLPEISKKGYYLLFDKIKNKEIKADFFDEFKKDLGFDPYLQFPLMSRLQCYNIITVREKMEGITIDKTNWQYQLMEAYWQIEAAGDLTFEDDNLKNVLNKIPEDKFQLIMYRKLFLDIIYFNLN
mgnify:CR=1 FL=1